MIAARSGEPEAGVTTSWLDTLGGTASGGGSTSLATWSAVHSLASEQRVSDDSPPRVVRHPRVQVGAELIEDLDFDRLAAPPAARARPGHRIPFRRQYPELQEGAAVLARYDMPIDDLEALSIDLLAGHKLVGRPPCLDELLCARLPVLRIGGFGIAGRFHHHGRSRLLCQRRTGGHEAARGEGT